MDVSQLAEVEVQTTHAEPRRLGDLWQARPAVLVFVRHFGWIFCRQQVAQLRDVAPEIQRRGAELVVIGPGSPKEATVFAERSKLEAIYLVSPDLEAYRAAGLKRSVTGTLSLAALSAGLKARMSGVKQGKIAGDPFQLGGAVVISAAGEVLFEHTAKSSADLVSPEALVAALGT